MKAYLVSSEKEGSRSRQRVQGGSTARGEAKSKAAGVQSTQHGRIFVQNQTVCMSLTVEEKGPISLMMATRFFPPHIECPLLAAGTGPGAGISREQSRQHPELLR